MMNRFSRCVMMVTLTFCIFGCAEKSLKPEDFHSDISTAFKNIQKYNDGLPSDTQKLSFDKLEETNEGYEMSFDVIKRPFICFYFHKDESLSKIIYGNINESMDINYDDLWIVAGMSAYYIFPQIILEEDNFSNVDNFLSTFKTNKERKLVIHEKYQPEFYFEKDVDKQIITLTVDAS